MRIPAALSLLLLTSALPALPQAPPKTPIVWVLSTGGTIAGQGATSTSLTEYKGGVLTGADLVKAVPEIPLIAEVKVEQIANVGSANITITHWLTLANRINQIFETEPTTAGVVITHGTNTMEETAYFLNLTVKHDRPVVLVGSMRPATAISADGPLNLLNAVRTAASPEARGKGVLLILNDEINAARDVTKTNTLRVETFRSPDLGYLGFVDGDKLSFYRSPTRRHTTQSEFDVTGLKQLPSVEILYSYVQPNPILIEALLTSGVKGIVMAGTGAGLVSTIEKDAIAKAKGTVIVRSSRTGSGRVPAREEYDSLGMIAADNLNPQKARILLMLALTKTTDPKEIRRIFDEY
ncbi:MAG: asparaginase [Acidobacteria bacterium]|nr:asparaginase [Acidobacteriota bacterium]